MRRKTSCGSEDGFETTEDCGELSLRDLVEGEMDAGGVWKSEEAICEAGDKRWRMGEWRRRKGEGKQETPGLAV